MGEGGLRAPLPADKDGQVKKVSPSVKFFGGALSGVIEALILTPLDVTKTRMQLDKTGQYRGMIDCGKKLVAAEGPKGLFKGFTPWTVHVVLKNGTRFYFNAIFRRMLSDKNGQVSGANEFVAGALAGATEAVLIVTPFEVIKTRLQGQNIIKGEIPKYRGPVHTAVTVVKHEGPACAVEGSGPDDRPPGSEPGLQLLVQQLYQEARVEAPGRRLAAGVEERSHGYDRRHPRPVHQLPHGRGQDASHGAGGRGGRGRQVQGNGGRHGRDRQGGGRQRAVQGPRAASRASVPVLRYPVARHGPGHRVLLQKLSEHATSVIDAYFVACSRSC